MAFVLFFSPRFARKRLIATVAIKMWGSCQRGIPPPFMFISPSDTKNLISFLTMPYPGQGYTGIFSGEAAPVSVESGAKFGTPVSGYGSMYDQLFAANPYRKQTYNQTEWQKFLSSLGFRTGYDDWLDQTSTQIAEYDAGIFSMMQQNEFNSEAAKADRMRAAGLNPDMLGIGDASQSAAPTDDPNGMNSSQSDELQPLSFVGQVSHSLLNIIPGVLSFTSQLNQLKGQRIENDVKELAFGSSAVDAATKFFVEGLTEQDYKDAFQKNDFTNLLDASRKDAKYLADTFFSSPSARKRFNLAYGIHSRSLLAEIQKYKSYDEFEKNRKSLLSQRASSFFSDDDDAMQGLLSGFLGPLERWQKRMNEINERKVNLRNPDLEQGLENKQMSNQMVYEQNIDPAMQAAAENTANERTSQENDILNATNELFADIMASLSAYDNIWAKLGMAFVGITRAQILSGMHLQFGRHSQYNVNGDTGVLSESGQSNVGISF